MRGKLQLCRGHQSWAVLARVLLSERPLHRRQLAAELFSDTADPLGALRWCLAALRLSLGRETLLGDLIEARLPPGTNVLDGHPGYTASAATISTTSSDTTFSIGWA